MGFAGWFALANPDLPRPVLILGTVLIAMLAGGIAGAIPGILRAYLGTSEVIVTIMMNYILLYSCNYIIRDVFADSLMKIQTRQLTCQQMPLTKQSGSVH